MNVWQAEFSDTNNDGRFPGDWYLPAWRVWHRNLRHAVWVKFARETDARRAADEMNRLHCVDGAFEEVAAYVTAHRGEITKLLIESCQW